MTIIRPIRPGLLAGGVWLYQRVIHIHNSTVPVQGATSYYGYVKLIHLIGYHARLRHLIGWDARLEAVDGSKLATYARKKYVRQPIE